jgi:putative tricarboxylic transport membrane protein
MLHAPWRPTAPVSILAGTAVGGGLDRVARALAAALDETRLLDAPVEVVNVPGDGARRVWGEVFRRPGDPHLLSVSSPNLTTDRLLGVADFGHAETTPIAVLVSEAIAFCVAAASPLRTGADLLATLAREPAELDIVLALADAARHAGHDAASLRVRAFDSAPDAVAAVVNGAADLGAVSAASVIHALNDGTLRVLGITAPERMPGPLAAVPNWVEQGLPCTIGAWRGISGPPGMPAEAVAFWSEAVAVASRTDVWREALLRQSWAPMLLTGDGLARHLKEEDAMMRAGLAELGLLPRAAA